MLSSAKASLPSQVYHLLSPQPQPLLFYLLANTKNVKVQNRIKNFLFKFPQILSRLPRTELQSLGVKPGPEFEQILSKIFALQLDGKIKSHAQLMKEMRQLAGIKEPPPPPPPPPAPKKGKEAAIELPAGPGRKKGRGSAPAVESPAHPLAGKESSAGRPAPGPPSQPLKAGAKPAAQGRDVKARAKLKKTAKPKRPVKPASKRGRKPRKK